MWLKMLKVLFHKRKPAHKRQLGQNDAGDNETLQTGEGNGGKTLFTVTVRILAR